MKKRFGEDTSKQRREHVVVDRAQAQLECGDVRGISFFGVQFWHPDGAAFSSGQFADLSREREVSASTYMGFPILALF